METSPLIRARASSVLDSRPLAVAGSSREPAYSSPRQSRSVGGWSQFTPLQCVREGGFAFVRECHTVNVIVSVCNWQAVGIGLVWIVARPPPPAAFRPLRFLSHPPPCPCHSPVAAFLRVLGKEQAGCTVVVGTRERLIGHGLPSVRCSRCDVVARASPDAGHDVGFISSGGLRGSMKDMPLRPVAGWFIRDRGSGSLASAPERPEVAPRSRVSQKAACSRSAWAII